MLSRTCSGLFSYASSHEVICLEGPCGHQVSPGDFFNGPRPSKSYTILFSKYCGHKALTSRPNRQTLHLFLEVWTELWHAGSRDDLFTVRPLRYEIHLVTRRKRGELWPVTVSICSHTPTQNSDSIILNATLEIQVINQLYFSR